MAKQTTAVLGQVLRAAANAGEAAVSDRELLGRFVDANDQAAFAALVRRHTGLILGVCRRAESFRRTMCLKKTLARSGCRNSSNPGIKA